MSKINNQISEQTKNALLTLRKQLQVLRTGSDPNFKNQGEAAAEAFQSGVDLAIGFINDLFSGDLPISIFTEWPSFQEKSE